MNATSTGQHSSRRADLHLETSGLRIKSILVATDYSEQATLAAKVAARLAKRFGSKLHVLHVTAPQVYVSAGGLTSALQQVNMELAREELHNYVAKIALLRTTKHEEVVLGGLPADAIAELAENLEIDLLVVGSRGRGGIGKLVLGSVAEAAIRRIQHPVLVIGPRCARRYESLKTIVLAAGLPASLRTAQYAMSIARESGASLTIVHVAPPRMSETKPPDEERRAKEALRQLVPDDDDLMKRVQIAILTGQRAKEIVSLANRSKAGLIIMGVREDKGMADHAPWATMSEVIRSAHCPVLAIQAHFR